MPIVTLVTWGSPEEGSEGGIRLDMRVPRVPIATMTPIPGLSSMVSTWSVSRVTYKRSRSDTWIRSDLGYPQMGHPDPGTT